MDKVKMNDPGSLLSQIGLGSIINLIVILIIAAMGMGWLRADIEALKDTREDMYELRQEVRSEYVTREQLEYIVIHRMDRMEQKIEDGFERLEEKMGENSN